MSVSKPDNEISYFRYIFHNVQRYTIILYVILQASKCGIVESIQSWMKFKAQEKMNKKCGSSKHSKLKGIPKLDDANEAGTKYVYKRISFHIWNDKSKACK